MWARTCGPGSVGQEEPLWASQTRSSTQQHEPPAVPTRLSRTGHAKRNCWARAEQWLPRAHWPRARAVRRAGVHEDGRRFGGGTLRREVSEARQKQKAAAVCAASRSTHPGQPWRRGGRLQPAGGRARWCLLACMLWRPRSRVTAAASGEQPAASSTQHAARRSPQQQQQQQRANEQPAPAAAAARSSNPGRCPESEPAHQSVGRDVSEQRANSAQRAASSNAATQGPRAESRSRWQNPVGSAPLAPLAPFASPRVAQAAAVLVSPVAAPGRRARGPSAERAPSCR